MSSILSTCSYARLINKGGQTLFIESSVAYSFNASKGLYIAGEVHLLVLYANFDVKHEGNVEYFKKRLCNVLGYFIHFVLAQDLISCSSNVRGIVQEPLSVNDDQRSSHKSLFPRHIGNVYIYYVVGSSKRTASAFFPLASTNIVRTKRFLIEKDFHVLPVTRRESYNANGLQDPIRANVEMLAIPSSSTLLGICYMPPKVGVDNRQVPLPSMLNHMARNSHKTKVFVLNFFEKFFYESVTFPLLIWFYLNLVDKVLISGGNIVVSMAGQVVGLEVKPQRGPRIKQFNTCFSCDTG
ncbi:hypothetical protein MTR67_038859 [Solanum verrucosum]|uniref:Uncharacterized protein n=1 Tax=Solanum verrucosum TaxID=315347 RepID=A0AAF0UGL9_SOLVR|nr:hypothetical protein MTR67_038859 [Solanum verrucosum]